MLNGVKNIILNIIKELKRGNIPFCLPVSDDFRKYNFFVWRKNCSINELEQDIKLIQYEAKVPIQRNNHS